MIQGGDDTQVRPAQASVWNIANALTISRVALVPVFAWFLLHDGGDSTSYRLFAAGVFAVGRQPTASTAVSRVRRGWSPTSAR